MPFLKRMLHDLETSGEQIRLNTLLSQKEIRPLNITMNNTILKEMHEYLQQLENDPFAFPIDLSLWDITLICDVSLVGGGDL